VRLRDIADVDSDSEVTGFALDHRKVARGSVFGAFRGAVFNGEDFIPDAVERGAIAVVERRSNRPLVSLIRSRASYSRPWLRNSTPPIRIQWSR
jgi:UDP-N-acetylmuramyl pentapeptide synthase